MDKVAFIQNIFLSSNMFVGIKFYCALHYYVEKRVISVDQLISWDRVGQPNPLASDAGLNFLRFWVRWFNIANLKCTSSLHHFLSHLQMCFCNNVVMMMTMVMMVMMVMLIASFLLESFLQICFFPVPRSREKTSTDRNVFVFFFPWSSVMMMITGLCAGDSLETGDTRLTV